MRSYGQWCALARALDVVGERWTLLIVRELLDGPKRYTDLVDGVCGISTDVLAARLRVLEADGLVTRRELPKPAASKVYELTEKGAGLAPVVSSLARWGMQLLGERGPDDEFRPHWLASGLRALLRADEADGVELDIEYHLDDDEIVHIRVEDRSLRYVPDPTVEPDLVVHASLGTLADLGDGSLRAADAIADGRLVLDGPREVVRTYARLFAPRR